MYCLIHYATAMFSDLLRSDVQTQQIHCAVVVV